MKTRSMSSRAVLSGLTLVAALAAAFWTPPPARAIATIAPEPAVCNRTLIANVVALDQVFFWNRLGAVEPQGMIYALRRDVVPIDSTLGIRPGNVMLREGKRARPLVLRMGVSDCLEVHFQNLLAPSPVDREQPATREASIHVVGLELVSSISDDGMNVGTNPSGLVAPGGTAVYTFYASREGEHVFHSGGAMTGGEGDGGSTNSGLFGAINVEPRGSMFYRSQVTRQDVLLAARKDTATGPTLTEADANFTLDGHPKIDYDALYPPWHPMAGTPILRMVDGQNEIVHSDLTAIIVGSSPNGGPGAGRFPEGTYPPVRVLPDRNQPYREFTIMYHDEIGAVQAFPLFEDPVFQHTLHSARDGFAINYGTGGIGAEILANRIGVGPMWNCTTCKYEEFFLSAWTVGDPAEIVDVPANAPCTVDDLRGTATTAVLCTPTPGPKATKVLYPDDPSNVYHSYLRDHVKFRILHGGSKEHHIHHLHAHQWIYSPDGDDSTYLDSQALGPGSSFTLEITYHGSGNRNLTVGDSIFHCHFYPHFAQGMWSLWRTHDVFEMGTRLDAEGRPAPGARALPDGEIAAGTPIPGLVPMPGKPMAPLPGTRVAIVNGEITFPNGVQGNPGYPFFVPGIAGDRPPHPPLDMAKFADGTYQDGGLPRHVVRQGGKTLEVHTRLDFTKELEDIDAVQLSETGEPAEQAAMTFHAQRTHPTCFPDGECDPDVGGAVSARFVTNGLAPQQGAPFADPCVRIDGTPAADHPRLYKAADIEVDAILNKAGWHFPQQRMIALWDDVKPTVDGLKAPEPLFFRANSNDCITYWLTNLVPNVYELDDFQVRTPTDVLGEHIHLVKFDVTSSDGAANGWNYEDGSFSPDEVRERIRAIRHHNGCLGDEIAGGDARDGTFACPVAKVHPAFGPGPDKNQDGVPDWIGAMTNVQRWYADDVLDVQGSDRTLRTVFTHDHFSPSTHQQAGLYAGLVVEPTGSIWRDPISGDIFGGRDDGGPTSWKADILTGDLDGDGHDDSYREFMVEFQDYQLAYKPNDRPLTPWLGRARLPGEGLDDPPNVINPPARVEAGLHELLAKADACPGGAPLPCPEAISAADVGTMSVNYRNEPVGLRVHDPATNGQAAGDAGDLSMAFSSLVTRADPAFNVQPRPYPTPINPNALPKDPFTPLMEAYQHDPVQIRILVGAHEEGHNFSVNGMKWNFEPAERDSGYRNSQMMGISEHFEFVVPQLIKNPLKDKTDFLWAAGSSRDDLWNGIWGLLRVYKSSASTILRLPSNPHGGNPILDTEAAKFNGVCPKDAPLRSYKVVAALARDVLPAGTLVYNSRPGAANVGPLQDPTAILYVRAGQLDSTGHLEAGLVPEPLVLRADAGDCIEVSLANRLPATPPDLDGWSALPMIVEKFNMNDIRPSTRVGLHPQLVYYDASRSDGNQIGTNPIETAAPGKTVDYQWFAGDVFVRSDGTVRVTPVEFGATNLIPSDRIKQPSKGLIGGLIVEPKGSTWAGDPLPTPPTSVEPLRRQTMATVTTADGSTFRELALFFQNDLNLRFGDGSPIPNLAQEEDPEDSGQKAFNYRTEPVWFRMGFKPDTPLTTTRTFDFSKVFTNAQVGGDPETPVFTATVGDGVRIRLLHPGGEQRNHIFHLDGHLWQQEPYTSPSTSPIGSTQIGANPVSFDEGAHMGIGPTCHADAVLLHGAGGSFGISGDYMFRDFQSFHLDGGMWGLFRVQDVTTTTP